MKHLKRVGEKLRGAWNFRSFLAVLVAALTGVAFGRNVLGTVSVVNGPSMFPTYSPEARLLTMPIVSPLKRSDVVILDDGSDKYAVKRVIGLPGEVVQIWRGHVFINHRLLVEPYLPKHTYTCPIDGRKVSETLFLKEGQYAVFGDNRACSTDSRSYGPVDEDQIKRRVPQPQNFTRASLDDNATPPPLPVRHHARVAK